MKSDLLIVGTGALATLFAARLSAAGVGITMLGSWRDGLEALRSTGARLDDWDGQAVQATSNASDCRGTKLALVLVKSWQTERSASQLGECLAEDGLAVTLQNGLGNDGILSQALGDKRVSCGVTTLGATLLAPGLVRSAGDGMITLMADSRLAGLSQMLALAEFAVSLTEKMEPAIWGKLTINAAINPLTALLRLRNGGLLVNAPACDLMGELAGETAKVSEACGVILPFSDPKKEVENVARRTADNISSMLQDVLRGAPTEVDAINGAVVRLGEQKGVPSPINRVIYSLVKALPVNDKL